MSRIASRSAGVALASAALVGLSSLALPGVAGADEVTCDPADATYSVEGGSIKWGFKQTFRNYFYGFAHGTHTLGEGVTFEGTNNGADGKYVWPISNGTISDSDTASASGAGSVNFNAHGGVLDTTISNPTVEIDGTSGSIKLDWVSNPFTTDPNADPEPATGTQTVAATFTLPSAANFHQDTQVTVTSPVSLIGDDFVPVFDSYPSGSELDPVTLVLDISSTCGGGDNGGGDNPGTDPGDGQLPGTDDQDDDGGFLGSLGKLFSFGS